MLTKEKLVGVCVEINNETQWDLMIQVGYRMTRLQLCGIRRQLWN